MLLAFLGSIRKVKNCNLGPENAALGLQPREAFSRLRSRKFFTIRTSQPASNIYECLNYEWRRAQMTSRKLTPRITETNPPFRGLLL